MLLIMQILNFLVQTILFWVRNIIPVHALVEKENIIILVSSLSWIQFLACFSVMHNVLSCFLSLLKKATCLAAVNLDKLYCSS